MPYADVDWTRDVIADLSSDRGTVRVRMGPGILRNFEIARSVAGFPCAPDRVPEVEAALGEDGWFGPDGIDRFLANLRSLGIHNGHGATRHVDVHVTAGFLAFSLPGAAMPRGWPPAPEVAAYLAAAGLDFTAAGSSGPKDAAATGSILDALKGLAGRSVFFIGSPRTRVFSRAIGVPAEAHFCIPDRAAYGLTDAVVSAARSFLRAPQSQPPIVMHAASLVGNSVLLELAATERPFVGIDLGLVATIYDDEYLSTRGWFIDHGGGIISTRDAIDNRAGRMAARDAASLRHARIVAFGRAWRNATVQWRSTPAAALLSLDTALEGAEDLRVPIASATSVLWRHALGVAIDPNRMERLLAENVKPEPLAIAAIVLRATGRTQSAIAALNRAAALSPHDTLVAELRRQATDEPGAAALPATMLTLPERPYLGSALSWSLSGDLARLWPDAHAVP